MDISCGTRDGTRIDTETLSYRSASMQISRDRPRQLSKSATDVLWKISETSYEQIDALWLEKEDLSPKLYKIVSRRKNSMYRHLKRSSPRSRGSANSILDRTPRTKRPK
jgi:hypothetical protein